jgi:two-component sensor histidine kinase
MKKGILLLLIFASTLSYSQNKSLIDSLEQVIKTVKNDSIIMRTHNKLRRLTYYSDAKSSKKHTEKYLEYAEKRKDSHNIILAHFYLGNANVVSGDYNKALDKFLIAANYYEQKKDSNKLGSVLNSLGAVHEKISNDSLSLYYYNIAKNIAKSRKDFRRSGIAGINIGNIYNDQGNNKKAIQYLEEAMDDLKKDESFKPFLNLAQINLASAYYNANKFNKANALYEKALKGIDTINDIYNHAGILLGKSNLLFRQHKIENAMHYGEQAYQKFKENNFIDEQFQMTPELIAIYKKLNKTDRVIDLYEEYTILKDSILNEKQDKNIANAIQKYESEKKDAQLKVLTLEGEKTEQQKMFFLYLALSGLLITLLTGYFLYKNNKSNKILASKNEIIKKALNDNEILLKETHHRVKNSLQMISSLLYLQSENIEDKKAAASVKDGQIRVKSMALIHQKLYQKDNLTGIEASDYINDLALSIFQSHHINNDQIKLNINVEKMVLDIDTITPLGIIINELIVNILKHAFTENTKNPQINISLHKQGPVLVLKILDNGKGIDLKKKKEKSFGLKLINSLSRKLKADLQITNNNGTLIQLNIKRFIIK